jgi:glycosyltransferase involved in cell wall biosynthesis
MHEPSAAVCETDPLEAPGPRPALRVAVVTETYPPEVNGVAATLSRVVQGLHRRGHGLLLVRPSQGGADTAPAEPRLRHRLVPGLPIPRYPGLHLGLPAAGALRTQWRRERPDVVHIVTEGPLGWSALRAARALALPVVSDFRTNFHAYARHYGARWLHDPMAAYLRWFHNRCASTMVPTEALRSELQALGFQRLRVVARGVDTEQFRPERRSDALRRSWGAGRETTVALYVGRLAPEKNLGLLFDAFEAMRRRWPTCKLVVVGDGPATAGLRNSGVDAVFAGLRRGSDLAAHYASADLFLFPSLTETFGNVVPEAMASGLPVLAYDCAAAGQLIRHGVNGLLAAPGDGAAFMAHAARLGGEREYLSQLGGAALATARAQGWERIIGLVEAEYRSAIDAMAAAPGPLALGRAATAR